MAQICTTSQHVLRVLQTSISSFTEFVYIGTLAREEEEVSLWKLNEVTLFVKKMARFRVKFSLKVQF